MTDMYDAPKTSEVSLPAYPHSERGSEVSSFARNKNQPSSNIPCSTLNAKKRFTHSFIIQRGRAQDPVAFLLSAEQRARERQVAYETVRLLRKDVIDCYRKEGVNHYDNCKEVTETYYKVVVKNDVGQVQPDWADKAKHDGF